MVVKNIVNIQNNRLDFDINGTNSLKYSFRGIEHFRLTEVDGTSHVQFIAQRSKGSNFTEVQTSGTNADFVGRISNIDNHILSNLDNVDATNAVKDEVLVYDGTNWRNKPSTDVGADKLTIGGDADSTSLIDLRTETFKILGTGNEIKTTLDIPSTAIIIGLTDSVFIREQLNIGSREGGTNAILNFNVSNSGTNRIIELNDVHGSNGFINVKDSRIRINHPNRIALRVADNNSVVIGTSGVTVGLGLNLFQTDSDGNEFFNSGTSQFIVYKSAQFVDDVEIMRGLYVDGTTGLNVTGGDTTLKRLIVNGDTAINGNLIVTGTQTILNTEIKLIEDPLIELGYVGTGGLTDPQDIGFFGQYKADNYAGLYYDVSSTAFRVFDSLGTNDYLTSLATNPGGNVVTTNANAANIEAKNFITKNGDFGQDIPNSLANLDNQGGAESVSTNFLTLLQSVYGTNSGLYCGKSLFMLYRNDFSASSSILLNYNFHSAGTNKILKTAVELETRGGDINFIEFDSNTNDIAADITGNPSGFYKFAIRLLPLLTKTVPELEILF